MLMYCILLCYIIDGFMPHFDVFMNKVQPIASRVPYQVIQYHTFYISINIIYS